MVLIGIIIALHRQIHLLTCVTGPKFWRSTRKMKAIRNEDYLEFHGMKKRPVVEFSDSGSDFDLPPFKLIKAATNSNLKIRECIDLTASGDSQLNDGQMSHSATNAEFTKLKDVTTRIEKIEAGLSKSLEKQELERVRRIVLFRRGEKGIREVH